MKLTRRKHPNRLVDSCKHSSINRMAAGWRLSIGTVKDFFLLSPHTLCNNFKQAVGPDLQHKKALINLKIKIK